MGRYGITLPSLNTSLADITDMIVAAEQAGFETVYSYEFFRNPYTGLAPAALRTDRITLATGCAIALTRMPFTTANAIVDIDEMSGGRALLTLTPGSPDFLGYFHNMPLERPVARMRDYLGAVYASWDWLATGKEFHFESPYYTINFPAEFPFGQRPMVRDRIPVYIGAQRPKMLQLAGELADGMHGAAMSLPYIRDVVYPNVAIGARRAGKDPSSVAVTTETIICCHPDRSEAMHRARIQVGLYAAHPVCDPIVQLAGLQKEQAALREALMTVGPSALESTTDDKLIELMSITGTPDECRKKVKDYQELLPHVAFHTPYAPPITGEESADSFRQILDAFAD